MITRIVLLLVRVGLSLVLGVATYVAVLMSSGVILPLPTTKNLLPFFVPLAIAAACFVGVMTLRKTNRLLFRVAEPTEQN